MDMFAFALIMAKDVGRFDVASVVLSDTWCILCRIGDSS